MATDLIHARLQEAFGDGPIEVIDRTGGGDHFQVVVESERFAGLSLVEQHRLVNRALHDLIEDGTIHELRIKTKGIV
ncbi:MAG: BolA family protein [Gaiellales bacterium]